MPATEKKKLYIGKNVGDLNRLAEHKVDRAANPKIYYNSAEKVFRKAEECFLDGDEEQSYILYMKYFNIITAIRKTKLYLENKDFYGKLINQKNSFRAIEQAEKLQQSLHNRYEEIEAEKLLRKRDEEREEKEKEKINAKKKKANEKSSNGKDYGTLDDELDSLLDGNIPDSTTPKGKQSSNQVNQSQSHLNDSKLLQNIKAKSSPFITAEELFQVLFRSPDPSKVLVLDTRPKTAYQRCHITNSACINVPAELLSQGVTVGGIERRLAESTRQYWKQRSFKELIVLLDQSSKYDHIDPSSKLQSLKDAIYKTDTNSCLAVEPLFLDGGFNSWLLHYPSMTTNPSLPEVKSEIPALLEETSLPDLDYPTLPTYNENTSQIKTVNGDSNVFKNNLQPTQQTVPLPQTPHRPPPPIPPQARDPFKAEQGNGVPQERGPSNVNGMAYGGYLNNFTPDVSPPSYSAARSLPTAPLPGTQANIPGQQLNNKAATTHNMPSAIVSQASQNITNQQPHQITPPQANTQPPPSHPNTALSQPKEATQLPGQIKPTMIPQNVQPTLPSAVQPTIPSTVQAGVQPTIPSSVGVQPTVSSSVQPGTQPASSIRPTVPSSTQPGVPQSKVPPSIPQPIMPTVQPTPPKPPTMQGQPKSIQPQPQPQPNIAQPAVPGYGPLKPPTTLPTTGGPQPAGHGAPGVQGVPQQTPQLPQGWERVWDPTSRRYYYKDHKNHKTHWEIPPHVMQPVPNAPQTAARGAQKPVPGHNDLVTPPTSTGRPTQSVPPRPGPSSVPNQLPQVKNSQTYNNLMKSQPDNSRPEQAPLKRTFGSRDEKTLPKSGLSRSLSSPNLAKLLDDEPLHPVINRSAKPSEPGQKAPTVNRGIKPLSNYQVDSLHPVAGGSGRALTGLRNLGNTCYMNSVIQCISSTTPLAEYFITGRFHSDLNRANVEGTKGQLAEEIALVVRVMYSGQYSALSPVNLKRTIGRFNGQFSGFDQQDSQELLTFLMTGLHEDTNKIKRKTPLKDPEDNIPDREMALRMWEEKKRLRDDSLIMDLFQGQYKSSLVCCYCRKKSVTFDTFTHHSLPLPSHGGPCTLGDCLKLFSTKETVAWKCPNCRVEREAYKSIEIWRLPPVLIIHLKRFAYEGMWRHKLQNPVDFPINSLDMSQHVLQPDKPAYYHLYAVSNHYGTMQGGHYTAFCKNVYNKRWFTFDDQSVSEMNIRDVKTSAGYLLFYTSVDFKPPSLF